MGRAQSFFKVRYSHSNSPEAMTANDQITRAKSTPVVHFLIEHIIHHMQYVKVVSEMKEGDKMSLTNAHTLQK